MSETALLLIFPALMAYAAASDLLTMTIPNRLSLALVAGFAAFAILAGLSMQAVLLHLGAGAAVLAASFALFAFGWIGGGDAKLAAATALWLGSVRRLPRRRRPHPRGPRPAQASAARLRGALGLARAAARAEDRGSLRDRPRGRGAVRLPANRDLECRRRLLTLADL